MRDEIMAGTPLEELKPLCVDLKQVKSHASYNPAKVTLPDCPMMWKNSQQVSACGLILLCPCFRS